MISQITHFRLPETDILVSFHVEYLFSKVPIAETVKLIREIPRPKVARFVTCRIMTEL